MYTAISVSLHRIAIFVLNIPQITGIQHGLKNKDIFIVKDTKHPTSKA